MNRVLVLVLAASLGLSSAACKTAPKEQPQASTGDFKGEHKLRFQEKAPEEPVTAGSSGSSHSSGPGVLDWVAAPFENIVYLPWKLIGGAIKGTSDGVSAGFGKDKSGSQRMPALGVLFLPVNLVFGFVTGALEGVALEPGLVGPEDSFGHAMSAPLKHPTSIWWYGE